MPTPWPNAASISAAIATSAPAVPAVFSNWPQGRTFTLSTTLPPWPDAASIAAALGRTGRTSPGR